MFRFLLLTSYLLITSCYVYAPNVNYRVSTALDLDTSIKTTMRERSGSLKTNTSPENCLQNIMDPPLKMPTRPTQEALDMAADHKAVDLLLINYINALKEYIAKQRTFYKDALEKASRC